MSLLSKVVESRGIEDFDKFLNPLWSNPYEIEGVAGELKKIYRRYKELGGKYMTTGSDAHNTDAVGMKIKEATELIRDWDMVPVYFKRRQMQLLS